MINLEHYVLRLESGVQISEWTLFFCRNTNDPERSLAWVSKKVPNYYRNSTEGAYRGEEGGVEPA